MVARCLICLFLICAIGLKAEDLALPEFELEDLEDRFWEQLSTDWVGSMDVLKPLSIYSSISLRDRDLADNIHYSNQLVYRPTHLRVYLNHLHEPARDTDYLSFSMLVKPPKTLLKELVTGYYRIQFGSGIAMGYSKSRSQFITIAPANNPQRYSPLGGAAVYGRGKLSLLAFASSQERGVTLSDSLITSVSKTRDSRLSSSQEEIIGSAIEYRGKYFQSGALYYHQEYAKAFSTKDKSSYQNVASGYATLMYKELELQIETALLGEDVAGLYALQYTHALVKHKISYASFSLSHYPAYAANPFTTGALAAKEELCYELRAQFADKLSGRINFALAQKHDSLKSKDLLFKTALEMDYKREINSHNMRLYRFDRELVSAIDSVFSASTPDHYRLHYRFTHKINAKATFVLKCSYSQEEKGDLDKNSFWWDSSYAHRTKGAFWKVGLATWNTQNHIYVLAEDYTDTDGYAVLKGSDISVYFSGNVRYKRMRFYLSGRKSLIEPAIRLNLGLRYQAA